MQDVHRPSATLTADSCDIHVSAAAPWHADCKSAQACAVQVIPTVGVNSDEDGKAAASQLRHFRNLIDNTASKKRFLSGFQKQVGP